MNIENEHVSICIPAHNAGWSIERTLNSILAQDYPNFDVFVCDNSSTDNTAEIVKNYDNRGVKYFFNPVISGGAEGNWNYALTLAKGPLIAVYHADDLYSPEIVRKQVGYFRSYPEISAVFTMMQTIDEYDRPIRMGRFMLPDKLKDTSIFDFAGYFNAVLKYCTFTPVPTMMTRRDVLEKVGNFRWQRYFSASDVDLYLRMARYCGPIGVINEPLHCYRISSGQGTAAISKGRTEPADYFRVIDDHLNDPEEKALASPESIAFYDMHKSADLIDCAINMLSQDRPTEASETLKKALKLGVFETAARNPRFIIKLSAGLMLYAATLMGIGTRLVSVLKRFIEYRRTRLRKPV
jgi:glycosyltransferase involved in cell wall biosynthesis